MSSISDCVGCQTNPPMFSLQSCGHKFCHPCIGVIYNRSIYTCSRCGMTSSDATKFRVTSVNPSPSSASALYPTFNQSASAAAASRDYGNINSFEKGRAALSQSPKFISFSDEKGRAALSQSPEFISFPESIPQSRPYGSLGDPNFSLLYRFDGWSQLQTNSSTYLVDVSTPSAKEFLKKQNENDWIVKDSKILKPGANQFALLFMFKKQGQVHEYGIVYSLSAKTWSLRELGSKYELGNVVMNGSMKDSILSAIRGKFGLNPSR